MQINLSKLLNPEKPAVRYERAFEDLASLPEGKYPLISLAPWWMVWRRTHEGWAHVSVNTLGQVNLVVTPFKNVHLPLFKRQIFKFTRLGDFVAYHVGRGADTQLVWLAALYDPEMFETAAQRAAWVWRHLDRQGIFDSQR